MNRFVIAPGLTLGLLMAALGGPPPKAPSREKDISAEVVSSNTAFALALYRKARVDHKGNLFYSPVSLMSAFGLVALGAKGATREQMLGVLQLNEKASPDQLAAFVSSMSLRNTKGTHLQLATGLWTQNGLRLEDDFRKAANGVQAHVEGLDFAQAEPSRKAINDWVEKQTHRKVRDMMPKGSIDPRTRAVLTSAVHFKGNWEFPFRRDTTRDADFFGLTGKVKVPLMLHRREFNYVSTSGVQVLELPFAGGELSMVFLLPEGRGELSRLEEQLDASTLSGWLRRLEPQRVDVQLPRFKIGVAFPLEGSLMGMGMKDVFGPKADLSGVARKGNLYLSEVYHRADVSLDEQGAEATAASGLVVTAKSAEPRVPLFKADHPFVFLVRDRRTNCVLFLGRLAQPRP